MRKFYLLIGMFCLMYHQALPQFDEVYASTHKHSPSDALRLESYSLKNGLGLLEEKFKVSIAYKDEWVENKTVQKPTTNFSTVEEAL